MKKEIQFDFSTVITQNTDVTLDCSYVSFVNAGSTDLIIDGNYVIPPGMERVFFSISDVHRITGTYNLSFADLANNPKCVIIKGVEYKRLFERKVNIDATSDGVIIRDDGIIGPV